MKENTEQKDFIVGDIHANAEAIQKRLKDVGFEMPEPKNISLLNSPEVVPNLNNINTADIVKSVREIIEIREKANIAHHDAQYQKMYPNKLK